MKFLGFVATFLVLFALSVVFLAAVDALPEPVGGNAPQEQAETRAFTVYSDAPLPQGGELPNRIVAKSIGMDVTVLNTESAEIAALDADLLKGAVRYPTSGLLGVDGTVLLLGHSSYLPIVRNQNYKAFNNIQKLKEGDMVSVYSAGREYRYTVEGVRLANADEDTVALRSNGQYLSLVTCNTFAAKTARYVVSARFDSVTLH
ncbi:MAG: sortase [Patescibacteria group bacterium]